MFSRISSTVATAVLMTIVTASRANAQTLTGSFDQLPLAVRLGDQVTVTDTSGSAVKGTIASLSPASLTLLVNGSRRELPEGSIQSISRSLHGSLRTGALWGFGLGAGLGTVALLSVASGCSDECAGYLPLVAAIYGGIGSGIGVGVSAMTTHRQMIYVHHSGLSTRLSIAPMVTRERKGLSLTLGW